MREPVVIIGVACSVMMGFVSADADQHSGSGVHLDLLFN